MKKIVMTNIRKIEKSKVDSVLNAVLKSVRKLSLVELKPINKHCRLSKQLSPIKNQTELGYENKGVNFTDAPYFKSIIYCPEEKVKQYTQLIKNSEIKPIAVISNSDKKVGKRLTSATVLLCIIVGLALGFVNGFLGGGGGMLCVPLLVFAIGLSDKKAHATAILIMLPISIVSFVVYAFTMQIEWTSAIWVTIGSIVGGLVGSLLLKKLSNSWLRAIFAVIMIVAGVRMLLN